MEGHWPGSPRPRAPGKKEHQPRGGDSQRGSRATTWAHRKHMHDLDPQTSTDLWDPPCTPTQEAELGRRAPGPVPNVGRRKGGLKM